MKPETNLEPDIMNTLGIDSSPNKRIRIMRFMGWCALGAVLLIAVVFWSARNHAKPVQYMTQPARMGGITVAVSATGNLEPTNQVDVGSELSGIVRSVEVDDNDIVRAGQILARLDTEKLTAKVLQSKASLESARSKVLQAQASIRETGSLLSRMKQAHELTGGKVPSKNDLDTAEAALVRAQADEASAKALVSQAQATLEADETDLKKASILSPINGIVLSRSVEPGQTVAASLQAPVLFTLAEDLARMELHVGVDEADVGRVHEGQQATFTVDAYPDATFPARIVRVSYGSDTTEGVVTYKTVLKVDNTDLKLRPGMTATADIIVEKVENALLVPNATLRFKPRSDNADAQEMKADKKSMVSRIMPRPPRRQKPSLGNDAPANGKQQVWTVRNGILTPVPVKTGATDGVMTEILQGGIKPGADLAVGLAGPRK